MSHQNHDYYIFGLQRTGTNYIEILLHRNFVTRKLNPGSRAWKHSINHPDGYQKNQPTVIIYKNPYTWIESLCLRNTVDWLKRQRDYPADEKPSGALLFGPKNLNVVNLAKTYAHWVDSWALNEDIIERRNTIIVMYEDLLDDKKRDLILTNVMNTFSWTPVRNPQNAPPHQPRRPGGRPHRLNAPKLPQQPPTNQSPPTPNPTQRRWINAHPGSISQSTDYTADRGEYYSKMMPSRLGPKHIAAINDVIGEDRMRTLGYFMI